MIAVLHHPVRPCRDEESEPLDITIDDSQPFPPYIFISLRDFTIALSVSGKQSRVVPKSTAYPCPIPGKPEGTLVQSELFWPPRDRLIDRPASSVYALPERKRSTTTSDTASGETMEHRQTHRSFVSYIDRTRDYYAAQGYPKPYAWSRHDDVPFASLRKPLSQCRVGLVTTAGKPQAEIKLDSLGLGLSARELYTQPAKPPPTSLYTKDLGWDKEATHTEDVDSFLPINRLSEYADDGRIGSVSPRFYGVPTDYSQSRTSLRYAPRILQWCREDSVDAVLLSAL